MGMDDALKKKKGLPLQIKNKHCFQGGKKMNKPDRLIFIAVWNFLKVLGPVIGMAAIAVFAFPPVIDSMSTGGIFGLIVAEFVLLVYITIAVATTPLPGQHRTSCPGRGKTGGFPARFHGNPRIYTQISDSALLLPSYFGSIVITTGFL